MLLEARSGLHPTTWLGMGGLVTLDGLDVRTRTLEAKQVTGYCPDVGGLVPRATPWEHLQLTARLRRLEIALQLEDVLREGVGAVEVAAQRTRRGLIGSRGAAQTQIYSIGIERSERSKLFGNHQRRMVGKHYTTGPNTN